MSTAKASGRGPQEPRKPDPAAGAPLVLPQDLKLLARLPLSAALAWAVPERHWHALALRAAGLEPATLARTARKIAAMIGPDRLPEPAAGLARRQLALIRLDQFCFLRSYRPGGWRPLLTLHGQDHLDQALAAGRGAILWVAPTVFQWLPAKRTLAEAGYRLHHLSSPQHGFSTPSRFGLAWLNPIRTRVEDRYLAERVMLGTDGQAKAALRRLTLLLRQNQVVSITLGSAGARTIRAPLLNGWLRAASGAPHLAARTGAALLPVITLRNGDGSFTTRIGAPLGRPGAAASDDDLSDLVARMARHLEPQVLADADQIVWGLGCLETGTAPPPDIAAIPGRPQP
ncbi:LpxL/LpxP family acyltransferase [Geminicoccus roseus]|uniref:LpxL/LpxP family acyltransferase n=1 Tax=Geminicoccus roseus TaxID=404900 RepID=UPI00041F825E|nr:hypothetical protein [Geminicoccus roseus]